MEVMYQRRCANFIYAVPEGLRELMSDISREVLRCQPTELYAYIANYLEALMITRENARVAAKAVSNLADSSQVIAELLHRTNMTREQANKVCSVIQKAFRKHLRHRATRHQAVDKEPLLQKMMMKTGISYAQAESSVIVIQRAYRTFRLRRAREQRDPLNWRSAYANTLALYRRSGVTAAEASRAATLIKAAYKGYYTRRVVRQLCEESRSPEQRRQELVKDREERELRVHETESWTIKNREQYVQNKAAAVIQRAFRQYLGRKKAEYESTMRSSRESRQMPEDIVEFVPRASLAAPDMHSLHGRGPYVENDEFEAMCEEIQLAAFEMDEMYGRGSGEAVLEAESQRSDWSEQEALASTRASDNTPANQAPPLTDN